MTHYVTLAHTHGRARNVRTVCLALVVFQCFSIHAFTYALKLFESASRAAESVSSLHGFHFKMYSAEVIK